ncbi:AAA family ATPase [Leptospira andrefontaineae]|uniref:ATP-binding protein n=1 Tax=Leptospira andrefontaineae TaxID=2484976 RepID=A0A4V6QL29_9LEPT|nr:AAA family ATPase [Leptospira andrefontaineae]TGK43649.1 ATP-binding protein [Leptospira andrefontaineae]
MNQNDLVNLLKDKLLSQKSNRLFIDGAWGIGKTRAIQKVEEELNGKKEFIYISLYGLQNITEFRRKLQIEIAARLKYSKKITNNKITKWIIELFTKGFKDSTSKFTGISIDLLELIAIELPKNTVLVIDDVERANDSNFQIELLGTIENIAGEIILIGNIQKIVAQSSRFQESLEKTIDRVYSLDRISDELLNSISFKNLPENIRDQIRFFFNDHNKENIRTFIKMNGFVLELSETIEIQEEITVIACAVINEYYLGHFEIKKRIDYEGENIFKINGSYSSDDFYKKYSISAFRNFHLVRMVVDYLIEGKINKDIYFKKDERDEDSLFIQDLKDSLYGTEENLIRTLNKLKEIIETNQFEFFKTFQKSIVAISWARYNQLEYNIGVISEPELIAGMERIIRFHFEENWNKLKSNTVIEDFFELSPDSLLPHDVFVHNEDLWEIARRLIKEYETRIEESIFKEAIRRQDYKSAKYILRNNQTIISKNFELYDRISQDLRNDPAFLNFLKEITESVIKNDQNLSKILSKKLRDFLDKEKDSLIRHRIEMLIGILNVGGDKD